MRPPSLEDEISRALEVLKKGGIILYPTDTIWGIGCDATNDEAISKIFSLKQREESKSLIVLLDTDNKLLRYVKEVPEQAWTLIEYSERPLTIIYENGLNVSKKILGDDGSLAIRITKDPFCQQLIHKFGKPLISTSANISGELPPASFHHITPAVLNGVDYVVNLRQNDKSTSKPSVIMKIGLNGEVKFIRK